MPSGFTKAFADRLNRLCPFPIKEGSQGDRVLELVLEGGGVGRADEAGERSEGEPPGAAEGDRERDARARGLLERALAGFEARGDTQWVEYVRARLSAANAAQIER